MVPETDTGRTAPDVLPFGNLAVQLEGYLVGTSDFSFLEHDGFPLDPQEVTLFAELCLERISTRLSAVRCRNGAIAFEDVTSIPSGQVTTNSPPGDTMR